jgi:quinol monooxygenase YgiN
MNTMAATAVLFRDYAFDHHATIYGEVSQGFIDLATQRMGPPTVFAFTQGLESPAAVQGGVTGHLQVIARVKVRPGQLEGFETQAAQILRLARERDTQTLRYDWFISKDETECEVHEAYLSEEGLIEHNQHVVAARDAWFRDYAFDHRMSVYGEISQQLSDLFRKHAGGVGKFSFVQGLERSTAPG